jgi:two-component system chemotaxis sensor kinase CheA
VDHIAEGRDLAALPEPMNIRQTELVQGLSQYLEGIPAHAAEPTHEQAPASCDGVVRPHWHLSLRFGADSLRNGMDPVAFLRYLATFGELLHVEPVLDHLPGFDTLDPETCYLGLEVAFRSDAEQAQIEGAFDFVREDGRIRILPPGASLASYAALLAEQAEEGDGQRQRLLRCGTLSDAELALLNAPQTNQPTAASLDAPATPNEPSEASATSKATKETARAGGESNLIRVDAGKLDQLINLVGELIIAGANTRLIS